MGLNAPPRRPASGAALRTIGPAIILAFPPGRMIGSARSWAERLAAMTPSRRARKRNVALGVMAMRLSATGMSGRDMEAHLGAYSALIEEELFRIERRGHNAAG